MIRCVYWGVHQIEVFYARIAELQVGWGGWVVSPQIGFQSVFSCRNRVQNLKVSVFSDPSKYGLFIR